MSTITRSRQVRTGARGVMLATALLLALPTSASAQSPGPSNTITDVAGVEVGQYTRNGDGFRTGTTVVLTRDGATTSYSSMGGGPGTKETDLLEPGGLVTEVQSVVLSGGSAFGLDTTTGVMRWLEERDLGYPVGQGVVPIVPGAILYDLGRGGDWDARPDAEFGYRAVDAATDEPVELGRVGAGAGASVGLGSASVELENGYTVGAIVGLNPGGSPVDPDTCLPYGTFLELDGEFGLTRPNGADCPQQRGGGAAAGAQASGYEEEFNTTIAVVATDAPLDQTQAQRMAQIANSGLSRSIKPVHNLGDGDTVFAMATTTPPAEVSNRELQAIYNGAADALGRAVVHATLESEGYGDREGYCERYPSACRHRDRGATSSGAGPNADDAATPAVFGGDLASGGPVELVTAGASSDGSSALVSVAATLAGVLGLLALLTRRRRARSEA